MKRKSSATKNSPKTKGTKRAKRDATSAVLTPSKFMHPELDVAHSPGHRKLNLKESPQTEYSKKAKSFAATKQLTDSDRISHQTPTSVRIIPGVPMGKNAKS